MQIAFVFSVFYSFRKIFVNNSKENENTGLVILFTIYLPTFQYSQILAVSQFYPPFLLASSPSFLDAWNRFVSRLIDNRVLFTMDTIKESHILLYYSFDFDGTEYVRRWRIVSRISVFPTFFTSFWEAWNVIFLQKICEYLFFYFMRFSFFFFRYRGFAQLVALIISSIRSIFNTLINVIEITIFNFWRKELNFNFVSTSTIIIVRQGF